MESKQQTLKKVKQPLTASQKDARKQWLRMKRKQAKMMKYEDYSWLELFK